MSSSGRSSSPRPILLDTNALLLPFRERFPLEEALSAWGGRSTWAVPSSVWAELESLAAAGAPGARAALAWARSLPQRVARGAGDDAILELARRTDAWVVTADRELQRRLREVGLDVLVPRGRSKLALQPAAPDRPSARRPPASHSVMKTTGVQRPRRR